MREEWSSPYLENNTMFNAITSALTAAAAATAPYLPYAACFAGGAAVATGVIYAPSAARSLRRLAAERSGEKAETPVAA